MKKTKQFLSLLICMALMLSYIPLNTGSARPLILVEGLGTVVDPGTADSWETMMGTDADGNRYAGRVWADKSVYADGDTAILNTRGEAGSSFPVELAEDEAFQVIFSALGSTMTTKRTVSSNGPLDVVLILDDSTSMDDIISDNTTRLEKLIDASNQLLSDLLSARDIRIGIVAYNLDDIQILPFGRYENGVRLQVKNNKFTFDENNTTDKGGTIQAFDRDGTLIHNNTKGYAEGTNLQAGFDAGMQMLQKATDTKGRTPVAIVLTDGASNTAVQNSFYDLSGQTPRQIFNNSVPASVGLATLLTAAYRKAAVEDVYGTAPVVYGVGVDLADNAAANAIINPGAAKDGFSSTNSHANIVTAYELYNSWLKGNTVFRDETYNGTYRFVIDHGYQNVSDITLEDIKNNINYVDTYYPVTSAELKDTFNQIYEELSSGVFNPISSSSSVAGGTGVDDTPLIYVDFIGEHMQIKKMQAITLFGNSYGIVNKSDGTYTVTEATGINPTTNEEWNTAEDILISITDQEDGTQKLEIRINQQILPIILEQAVTETVGDVTTSTITELMQPPLRVYYTVGLHSDILLPNGEVDISKIQGYSHIDDVNGTASFYSNRFGVMNPEGTNGDAHVGFKPSEANRYYYHQTNQGIFTKVTNKSDGSTVTIPENNQYGILWDEKKYDLSWMTYEEYLATADTDKVYTYVSYTRPTPSTADDANAAEEVTYLVYTDWKYLKESVAFYDANSTTYLDEGKAIAPDQVEATVAAYLRSNPNAQLYAVLGIGSLRTSRFHNMTTAKTENTTGSADNRYAPEYTYETATVHNGNDVVVWLGNNGKLTVQLDTGIALTKKVTEPIGNPDDTYTLTVKIPPGVVTAPVVADADGNPVPGRFDNHLLTLHVKADQTVYISRIPGGTECEIGEIIDGDYYLVEKTDKVRIPLLSEALNGAPQFVTATVTNAPNKYANLFITKEITSDHAVPDSVLDTPFDITVDVGTELAGRTFAVEDSAHTDPYEVTVDEAGHICFQIKARQTLEILDLPEGTAVTVTEEAPDSHFQVSYRTRNHSGQEADRDNTLVIPGEGNATAVVINHYTPTAVSADLDIAGTKIFTAEGNHEGGKFVYKVQKWTGSGWEDIPGKTAETPYAENEDGTKTFTIENVLEGITYTEVGSHAYQVIEVKGQSTNVTFDRTLYTFTVTVTDGGGDLVATVTDLNNTPITDGTYEVTFHNTYHTAPVSVDIVKDVVNTSGDTTVSKAGFEFKALQTDANWNVLEDAAVLSVFTDGAGEARLTATYDTPGIYRYLVTEQDPNAPGWICSDAKYRITVTVTEDGSDLNAVLEIEKINSDNAGEKASVDPEDPTRGTISFVNTYDPQDAVVDLDGAVCKELTGMTLDAEQFTFYVYADGDRTEPVLTGTNSRNGRVEFDKALTFGKEGKYQYDIVESVPADALYDPATGKYVLFGMRYDATVYDLVIEVTNDPDTGKLVASRYFEDAVTDTVAFRNSYQATPTEYVLGGHKLLHGRAPRSGEFTFALYEGDELKQTVTNIADGSFRFKSITYTEAGTYTYTIQEVAGSAPGIRYDGAEKPITVTVTVTDTDGVLSASADIGNPEISFENTYTAAPAQVTFNGTKVLVGEDLEDHRFTFRLYNTDNTFDVTGDNAKLLATAQNVDGAFEFAASLSAAGVYYFVVLEDSNGASDLMYDRTEYWFSVKVSDVGDGQLTATLINVVTGEATDPAASVSADVTFTNATFDAVVRKEVYLAEDLTTEIDGQKVNPGDILTYRITYTNYTGGNVTVNIMDAIPEHTTYVEDSITYNGAYAFGYVNWILNLTRGRTRTVSFQVQVDEPGVTITNSATVRDSFNSYITNEVVNYTEEVPVEEDPTDPPTDDPTTEPPVTEPAPTDPPADNNPDIPSIPKTDDNLNLQLWFTVLLVSCGALITVLICGKKRMEI